MSAGEQRRAAEGGAVRHAEGDEAPAAASAVVACCELCAAARFTEWFYDDEECWIAECDSCSVPMVVWRVHDPAPSPDVRARLHARLAAVVAAHFEDEHVVDDHLRTIPSHYHAHARPRRWGAPLRRRSDRSVSGDPSAVGENSGT